MSATLTSTWVDLAEIPEVDPTLMSNMPVRPVPEVRTLSALVRPEGDADDELLKDRYLCRGSGLLMVGQTGIGKSSLVLQCAILWSLGKAAFGIRPASPLSIILIQAENDDGDVAEVRDGIFAGLGLSPENAALAGERIKVVREDERVGLEFCALLESFIAEHHPDLAIIDPVLAFLGGDASSQRDVSGFLRGGLNPILRRHGCGAILVHHTNKPAAEKKKDTWSGGDFAYLGSGSAEWANWARAVITLRATGGHDYFELGLGKRGPRVGWKHEDGVTTRYAARLAHGQGDGKIYWREVSEIEVAMGGAEDPTAPKGKLHILPLVPRDDSISKAALISAAQGIGIGMNRAKGFIAELIHEGALHEWKISRSGTRPEIHLALSPQPGGSAQ